MLDKKWSGKDTKTGLNEWKYRIVWIYGGIRKQKNMA